MNLKHLETFAWIARLGSFSAAAERLGTSQPAVSMRIAELERTLGTKLFDRAGRSARITPKGRELIDYAERILSLASEAEDRLGDLRSVSGRLRLGVSETVALTWLPHLVARLNETYPHLMIDLDIDLTNGLWRKLRAAELDLAMLPGPAFGADLVTHYLGSAEYAWMASPRLDIPRRPLTPADLAAVPIITLSPDSNLHDVIETWFHDKRQTPHRVDVCNSLGVVAALTVAGLGVSLLPPEIFNAEIERGELCTLDVSPTLDPLRFWSVYPRGREASLEDAICGIAKQVSNFQL